MANAYGECCIDCTSPVRLGVHHALSRQTYRDEAAKQWRAFADRLLSSIEGPTRSFRALPGQPVDPEDAQSYFRTGRFHSGLPVSASDAQSYFTTGELPDPSTQNRQLGVSREQPGFVGCGPFAPAPAPNSPATFARKHTSLSRPGGTRGSLPASPAASHQAVPTKPLPKTSQPKPQTIRTSPESEAQLSAYSVVFGDISTSYRRTDPTTTTDAKSHLLGRFPMRSLPPVRSSVSGNASPIPSHSTAAKSTALKPHRQMEQGPKVAGLSGSAVESSQLKPAAVPNVSSKKLKLQPFLSKRTPQWPERPQSRNAYISQPVYDNGQYPPLGGRNSTA